MGAPENRKWKFLADRNRTLLLAHPAGGVRMQTAPRELACTREVQCSFTESPPFNPITINHYPPTQSPLLHHPYSETLFPRRKRIFPYFFHSTTSFQQAGCAISRRRRRSPHKKQVDRIASMPLVCMQFPISGAARWRLRRAADGYGLGKRVRGSRTRRAATPARLED